MLSNILIYEGQRLKWLVKTLHSRTCAKEHQNVEDRGRIVFEVLGCKIPFYQDFIRICLIPFNQSQKRTEATNKPSRRILNERAASSCQEPNKPSVILVVELHATSSHTDPPLLGSVLVARCFQVVLLKPC
jgi:hypothetical protein